MEEIQIRPEFRREYSMRKNKRLKKELLLYKKEVVLKLNEYILNEVNKDELNNLIGDISLTNEMISVLRKINSMESTFMKILEFPIDSEFISIDVIKEYFYTHKYYDSLLNEIIKQKFNSKVLKNQLNLK